MRQNWVAALMSADRLHRASLQVFMLRGVGLALMFAMHTVAARLASPEGYGLFTLALGISTILGVVTPLGFPTAIQRFIAQGTADGNWSLVRGALRKSHQITIAVSLAALVSCVTVGLFLDDPALRSGLIWGGLLLVPFSLTDLRRNALQGFGRAQLSVGFDQILVPVVALLGYVIFRPDTGGGITGTYLFATLLAAVVGGIALRRCVPTRERSTKPSFDVRAGLIVAVPMMLGGVGNAIMVRGDVVVLGGLLDLETVGLYGAAWRYAMLINFGVATVNTVAGPSLVRSNGPMDLKKILRSARRLSWLLTLPLFLPIVLFADQLLALFGAEYVAAGGVLRVLAIGQLAYASVGPVGLALSMKGKERSYAGVVCLTAMGAVLAYVIVTPLAGVLGAALVNAATFATVAVLAHFLVRKLLTRE